ncbi:hypothetical protein [Longitalea arenae]|uniref:hypothetical protein n=1 Tax=Longitalea arenae TaxID=2812558 RepID=UPI00196747A7|nr:hypothetical protein [Longitalea arenae]
MNNNLLKQLWLAVRIWLVAVITNAALGAFYLDDFSITRYTGQFFLAGLLWGSVFSLPVMAALYYLIKHCVYTHKSGSKIFGFVIILSVFVTVLVFICFWGLVGIGDYRLMASLLGIALLSGLIAVSIHYRSLIKLGSDYHQTYSHE